MKTSESPDRPMTEEEQATSDQVKIVLDSAAFRNAPALRRLLKFLTDKLIAGEADQLKEYSIGVDALGKAETFDPKKDSIVRLQMSRLRQKLAEYERTEGSDDPYILELPKGTFRLNCKERPVSPTVVEPARPASRKYLEWTIAVTLIWAVVASVAFWREHAKSSQFQNLWTPALEELWRPMLASTRPLVIAIEEPPFVQLTGFGVYRELRLNRWDDIERSPSVAAIRKALNNPGIEPNYYYAPMGEVTGSFLLGRLLGSRVPGLSLTGTRDLSWRRLGDSNIIYSGTAGFIADLLKPLPLQPQLTQTGRGVLNPHSGPGESASYVDQLPEGPAGDGEAYALVTHLPGPAGTGTVITFASSSTSGRLAAIQYLTDPAHAQTLVGEMKKKSGGMPLYYQVLLKVNFKGGVPLQTSYVLCRELKLT